jgi:Tol biopolymer transport system component
MDFIGKDSRLHSCPVFSPDGKEVYWSQMGEGNDGLFFMECVNNQWTPPEKFEPSDKFVCGDPFISPDGQRLYFAAQFFPDYDENIMFVDRTENGWSSARSVGEEINTLNLHWQMSVNKNLDLYFQVRNEKKTSGDIYWAQFQNGHYQKPEKLDEEINTSAWEQFPCISPDGKYLFFTSTGRDGRRIPDKPLTYEDFKKVHTSPKNGLSDIYWVDAKIVEDLKPEDLK